MTGSGAAATQCREPWLPWSPLTQVGGRTGVEGPGLERGQRIAYGLLILLRYVWTRAGSVVARAAVRTAAILQEHRGCASLGTSSRTKKSGARQVLVWSVQVPLVVCRHRRRRGHGRRVPGRSCGTPRQQKGSCQPSTCWCFCGAACTGADVVPAQCGIQTSILCLVLSSSLWPV